MLNVTLPVEMGVFSTTPSRHTLMAPVNTSLPHVILPLGKIFNDNLPGTIYLVDSTAGLTTGSIKFLTGIACQFPDTVACVYSPEDYTPITLSGIVSKDNICFTTELNVGFEIPPPVLDLGWQYCDQFLCSGC